MKVNKKKVLKLNETLSPDKVLELIIMQLSCGNYL